MNSLHGLLIFAQQNGADEEGVIDHIFEFVHHLVLALAHLVPQDDMYAFPLSMYGLLTILLIGLVCGSVGSLVVGNRMAFFSDALAHCAFAGVSLGLLLGLVLRVDIRHFSDWITLIMVLFGILVGLGIAFVRERTNQANDTVIGVFFAGAIGLGAIFLKSGAARRYMPPEDFLFGNLATIDSKTLLELFTLTVVVGVVLIFTYNSLVFASFSATLGRSRGIRVRLLTYLFIVLLGVIVNVCITAVGALLINALLIVPAATAANLCRNMRQLFPCAIGLCIFAGVAGQRLSWQLSQDLHFDIGESGAIVVTAVLCYFLSILLRPWLARARPLALPPG
jgi:zinc transport system permease protein